MKTLFNITIFIIYSFLISPCVSNAQSFTSIISSPEDDSPLGVVADHNGGSYLVSWRGTNDPYATDPNYYFDNFRNIIYHLNKEVNISDSIEIDMLGGYDWSLWNLYLVGDSLLAWGTAYNEMNESCHLGILWLDANLQIIDYSIHGNFSDSVQFIDFTLENQGNMIFAGFHGWTYTLHLIKIDSNGEFIMENSIPLWGIPYPNICYLPASDQIMCGRFDWIGFVNNSDLSADTLYLPEIFTSGYFGDGWYIRFDESSAIMPGLSLKGPPNIAWNFGCIIFDTLANVRDSVLFTTDYDQNANMEVDFKTTDSIFFGGLENTEFYNPGMYSFDPIDRYYYLTMFNFSGDRFWTLHLGGDANYGLMGLTVLDNNDCLVAGARYDWRNNPELERDIYLYKISSDGVLVGIPEIPQEDYSIFPNPGKEFINIHSIREDTELHLFDLSGRIVLKTTLDQGMNSIPISWLPTGMYIYRIIGQELKKPIEGKWIKA